MGARSGKRRAGGGPWCATTSAALQVMAKVPVLSGVWSPGMRRISRCSHAVGHFGRHVELFGQDSRVLRRFPDNDSAVSLHAAGVRTRGQHCLGDSSRQILAAGRGPAGDRNGPISVAAQQSAANGVESRDGCTGRTGRHDRRGMRMDRRLAFIPMRTLHELEQHAGLDRWLRLTAEYWGRSLCVDHDKVGGLSRRSFSRCGHQHPFLALRPGDAHGGIAASHRVDMPRGQGGDGGAQAATMRKVRIVAMLFAESQRCRRCAPAAGEEAAREQGCSCANEKAK